MNCTCDFSDFCELHPDLDRTYDRMPNVISGIETEGSDDADNGLTGAAWLRRDNAALCAESEAAASNFKQVMGVR
jgi:hypothetical protein